MTITTRTHTKDIATTAIATTKAPEHTVKNILSLSRMMQFGDSMLPVGAFAFSNGLESAVQKGVVHDAETLRQYTHTALEQAAKGDAVAVVWATRAALAGDLEELIRVDREVLCRKLNEETRLMATRMGRKLAEIGADITENPLVIGWRDAIKDGGDLSGLPRRAVRGNGPLHAGEARRRNARRSPHRPPVRRRHDHPERIHAHHAHQPY